ncbi:restriction endonuclease [Brazilian marseillevirus]|uniref:restriction endonuclease n=1 Tax=Brazilian marseillevirus TaxID=1813599 RepID=UPI000785A839|nr:restriction endonuclease [Brazilian marseillevirus]AMQ10977.1 restriction endonuclease [Brazilian marseillevirus]
MARTKKISCEERRMGICGKEECIVCLPKSFASHPRVKNWNFEKNEVLPHQISRTSNRMCWFICHDCGHELHALMNNVARKNNPTWCKYCNKNDLCDSEDCLFCYENSFANNPKSSSWSLLNFPVTPRDVRKSSIKKFWFDCDDCGHSYESTVDDIVHRDTTGCRYCASSNGRLCKDEKCSLCHKNSYASHEMSKNWILEKNKNITPRQVRITSGKKFWHKCPKCEQNFQAMVRDTVQKGNGCPFCKNKTELKVLEFLQEEYGKKRVVHQFKAEWCRNPETGKFLPFDICIGDLIIEVDGRQHFEQVARWTTPEETQRRDKFKEEMARNNGYRIIRLFQPDVWTDKIDWRQKLIENIKDF